MSLSEKEYVTAVRGSIESKLLNQAEGKALGETTSRRSAFPDLAVTEDFSAYQLGAESADEARVAAEGKMSESTWCGGVHAEGDTGPLCGTNVKEGPMEQELPFSELPAVEAHDTLVGSDAGFSMGATRPCTGAATTGCDSPSISLSSSCPATVSPKKQSPTLSCRSGSGADGADCCIPLFRPQSSCSTISSYHFSSKGSFSPVSLSRSASLLDDPANFVQDGMPPLRKDTGFSFGKDSAQSPKSASVSGGALAVEPTGVPECKLPSPLPLVEKSSVRAGETAMDEEEDETNAALQGAAEMKGHREGSALSHAGADGMGIGFASSGEESLADKISDEVDFKQQRPPEGAENGIHTGHAAPRKTTTDGAFPEVSLTSASDESHGVLVSAENQVNSLETREPEGYVSDSQNGKLLNLLEQYRQSLQVCEASVARTGECTGYPEVTESLRSALPVVAESAPTGCLTDVEVQSEGGNSFTEAAPQSSGALHASTPHPSSVQSDTVRCSVPKQESRPSWKSSGHEEEHDWEDHMLLQRSSSSSLSDLATVAANSFSALRRGGNSEHFDPDRKLSRASLSEENIEQLTRAFAGAPDYRNHAATDTAGMEEENLPFDETPFLLGKMKKQRRGTCSTSCSEVSNLSRMKDRACFGEAKTKRGSMASTGSGAQSVFDEPARFSGVQEAKRGHNGYILSALQRCDSQFFRPCQNAEPPLGSVSDAAAPEWLRNSQESRGTSFRNDSDEATLGFLRSAPASPSTDAGCEYGDVSPDATPRRSFSGCLMESSCTSLCSSPSWTGSPAVSATSRSASPKSSYMINHSTRSRDLSPIGRHAAESTRVPGVSEEALRSFLPSCSVGSTSSCESASPSPRALHVAPPARATVVVEKNITRTLSRREAAWDGVPHPPFADTCPRSKTAVASSKAFISSACSSQTVEQCGTQPPKGASKALHPHMSLAALSLLDAMASKSQDELHMFIEGLQTACVLLRGNSTTDASADSLVGLMMSAIVSSLTPKPGVKAHEPAAPAAACRSGEHALTSLMIPLGSESDRSSPTASSAVAVTKHDKRSAQRSKCEERPSLLSSVASGAAKPKATPSLLETTETEATETRSGSGNPESRKRLRGSTVSLASEEERSGVKRSYSALDTLSSASMRSAHSAETETSQQVFSFLLKSLEASPSKSDEAFGPAGNEGVPLDISRKSSESRTTCTVLSHAAKARRKRSRNDDGEAGDAAGARDIKRFPILSSARPIIVPASLCAAKPKNALSSAWFSGQPEALAELSALLQCGHSQEAGGEIRRCPTNRSERVKPEATAEHVAASCSPGEAAARQSVERIPNADVRLWRFTDAGGSPVGKTFEELQVKKQGSIEVPASNAGTAATWPSTNRQEQAGAEAMQQLSATCEQKGRAATSKKEARPETRMYACPLCNGLFSRNYNLHHHIRAVHEGVKSFVCPICQKKFSYKRGNLEQHIQAVHRGEKPFLCNICGRAFSQKGNLSQHTQAVHAGNRPFQCPQCSRAFSRKSHLHRHITSLKHYGPAGSSVNVSQLSAGMLEKEMARDADSSN
ncbi:zinc finger, c2h2 type domain-containing protein [Toxoplasma gondii TgCatPRC2]|uniref:Zinc finger, c2h2 type domain-containing protein n=2 Tax=Toxoplasma gondii TaxID=5811 RepID=A0A151H413_TOXGO|nr:zinc finger, c2h2 type domain-containing protein [Toxoplasma gondii ARI]KYK64094.1 zinc finger, c2h2 type domain-containing protein [Toxoplasma gondii TgCatPRC2]